MFKKSCTIVIVTHYILKNVQDFFNIYCVILWMVGNFSDTLCPKSSDPFYIVTYYIKWVTTHWTDGTVAEGSARKVEKVIDNMLIWRTVLLVLLSLAALVGGALTLVDYGLHPVQPASVKKIKAR